MIDLNIINYNPTTLNRVQRTHRQSKKYELHNHWTVTTQPV